MKRFTKIALIIAAVMAMIGVVCMVASFSMGFTMETFVNMVKDGKFSYGPVNKSIQESDSTALIDEICQELEVDFAAGVLEIYHDDVEQIQIKEKNVPGFKSYVEGKTLHIGGKINSTSSPDASLIIVLPLNMKFEEVDLNIGASKAEITDLAAKDFSIEVGAGEATILNLDVRDLEATTGVGKLIMELAGKESDYNYQIECGIGEIEIGENSYGGLGTEQKISNPGANRSMDVECGIGEVQIQFTE